MSRRIAILSILSFLALGSLSVAQRICPQRLNETHRFLKFVVSP